MRVKEFGAALCILAAKVGDLLATIPAAVHLHAIIDFDFSVLAPTIIELVLDVACIVSISDGNSVDVSYASSLSATVSRQEGTRVGFLCTN